jgi:hypothetical protein
MYHFEKLDTDQKIFNYVAKNYTTKDVDQSHIMMDVYIRMRKETNVLLVI